MRFQKGQSGNPGGKPKELKGVQELARSHAPEAIRTLAGIMKNSKAGPAARAMASNSLLDRGYGRPAQFVTGDAARLRSALDMSDNELADIAAGGGEGTDPAPLDPSQLN